MWGRRRRKSLFPLPIPVMNGPPSCNRRARETTWSFEKTLQTLTPISGVGRKGFLCAAHPSDKQFRDRWCSSNPSGLWVRQPTAAYAAFPPTLPAAGNAIRSWGATRARRPRRNSEALPGARSPFPISSAQCAPEPLRPTEGGEVRAGARVTRSVQRRQRLPSGKS